MTFLRIYADEIRNPSPREYSAMRRRLFEHDIGKAQAERDAKREREAAQNRARIEAAETARLEALAEAKRIRLEIEAEAARLRTAELVAQFHIVPVRGEAISIKEILQDVSAKHGFTAAEIAGPRRHHALVLARQEAMYRIVVECPHLSYPAIGRRLGGRDHSTTWHGCRTHAQRHGLPLPDRSAGRSS